MDDGWPEQHEEDGPGLKVSPADLHRHEYDPHWEAARAVRLGLLLAIVPFAFFAWGAMHELPATLKYPVSAVFIASALLAEATRWIITAWLHGLLRPHLPGGVGLLKAAALVGAWFAAAVPIHIVNRWTVNEDDRIWLFPGLQLLLFLGVLAIGLDLLALRRHEPNSWGKAWGRLQTAYHVERTRTLVLYLVPVALAVLAIAQQVVSGTGLDFVTSVLNGATSAAGGGTLGPVNEHSRRQRSWNRWGGLTSWTTKRSHNAREGCLVCCVATHRLTSAQLAIPTQCNGAP